jgi:hypothetical protein
MPYPNDPAPTSRTPGTAADRRSSWAYELERIGPKPEEFELRTSGDEYEDWEDEDGRLDRFVAIVRGTARRLAWLGLCALLALGSAGITAATGRSPANDGRPELTYAADTELSDRLDAGVRDLTLLNQDVIHLGSLTRSVLADVSQLNQTRLAADYQDGDATLASIDAGAAGLSSRLECAPWPDSRDAELALTYSQGLIFRWHQVCSSLDSVQPLADDWAAMVSGSKVVIEVTGDISLHDNNAAAALQLATQGDYKQALTQLAIATGALDDADRIATMMAAVGDVSTLTDWLSRTRAMDDALGVLWQTMIQSQGRVTPQVTAALKNVASAKAMLPDNTSILQIVIYELAGGLTSHGLSIETAKGELNQALTDITGGLVQGTQGN